MVVVTTTTKSRVSCVGAASSSDYRPASVHSGDMGRVVVYANYISDTVLASEMLEFCGYTLHTQQSPDQSLGQSLAEQSTQENYGAVICSRRGEEQLILPLLTSIRATRVVVLSDNDEENTIVSMLNSGAHHYFDIDEAEAVLKMRLKASLRIHNTRMAQFLTIDDITFDTQKRAVSRDGRHIDLSPKEFELAFYLFSNLDRVIGNNELMNSVWSLPAHMDSRRIDTAACRVRKKLGLSSPFGWELKRIRMVGYRLAKLESIEDNQTDDSIAC